MRYSQRLGSVVLVTTVSFPHSRRTWGGRVAGGGSGGLSQAWVHPCYPQPSLPPRPLTVVERLGPCQQPVPCSYFMALNLSCSGPAHEPQVLQESEVLRMGWLGVWGCQGKEGSA